MHEPSEPAPPPRASSAHQSILAEAKQRIETRTRQAVCKARILPNRFHDFSRAERSTRRGEGVTRGIGLLMVPVAAKGSIPSPAHPGRVSPIGFPPFGAGRPSHWNHRASHRNTFAASGPRSTHRNRRFRYWSRRSSHGSRRSNHLRPSFQPREIPLDTKHVVRMVTG